jgi:cytochrome c oxidase cbb3-type subunit III
MIRMTHVRKFVLSLLVGIAVAVVTGCGKPTEPHVTPEQVMDFPTLYATNCAGCHGVDGRHGAAQSLNDPLYLALVRDKQIREVVTNGIPGTPMLAFGREAGGTLTADQIGVLVGGMRQAWGSDQFDGMSLPPYSVEETAVVDAVEEAASGDATSGRDAYKVFCARCHGDEGRGGPSAGSIVDQSFLSLTSDQALRTAVIAGHGDHDATGWRSYVPGRPMSAQEISRVVRWLSSQRGHHD